MKYFDSHCHLNTEPLLSQQDIIFEELTKKNFIVNVVGFDISSSLIAVEQAKQKNVFATIGIHPCDINGEIDLSKNKLEKMLHTSNKIIAIGETGFDFYHTKKTEKLYQEQLKWLEMHYEVAKNNNLPLMIHVRDGHQEMIDWLKKKNYNKVIIHCFNQSIEIAKHYLDLNCYLSIPGVVTYKNAIDLQKAISFIPDDLILVETDAPYLSPVPYRGKINMPYFSIETYQKIAELKKMSIDKMKEKIFKNSCKIFNLNEKELG